MQEIVAEETLNEIHKISILKVTGKHLWSIIQKLNIHRHAQNNINNIWLIFVRKWRH